MDIENNIAFFFCFAFALFIPQAVAASVVITEIMYDASGADSGREWVEIFNDGMEPVSLEGWRFLENGTKHKLTSVSSGNTIQPGGYAIIADNADNFRADFPGFNGQLFDSAFSLSNTGETVSLLDGSGMTVFSAAYQATASDGNSLNRSGSEYLVRTPTPGAAIAASAMAPPVKETKAPKQTKEKAPAAADVEVAVDEPPISEIVGEAPERVVAAKQQTAAAVFSKSSVLWWVAAMFIALAAGGVLFYSRSLKKDEWNIVEQSE
ncbi:MAG TPA: lamin tail domain-containing protein [Candidatus Paceibacterota bacterium]